MGELRMHRQLFTSVLSSSTPRDMVEGGFLRSDSPSFVFSAADKAFRSGSSSLAPKLLVSSSTVSSRPNLGLHRVLEDLVPRTHIHEPRRVEKDPAPRTQVQSFPLLRVWWLSIPSRRIGANCGPKQGLRRKVFQNLLPTL